MYAQFGHMEIKPPVNERMREQAVKEAHPHCHRLCISSMLIVAARLHSLLLPAHHIHPS
jgi:hypothetical protein